MMDEMSISSRSDQPNPGRAGGVHPEWDPDFPLLPMSTFSLQTVVSAPLELDSDCMEPRAAGPHEPGFQARSLGHAGSGGLGMALEEELAMLTGDRDDQEELPDQETPSPGQNADLLSLFRQKEKDLVLAAKLGKALLERNQDLTKQYEKMHKDLNEKLEVN